MKSSNSPAVPAAHAKTAYFHEQTKLKRTGARFAAKPITHLRSKNIE